ncbi:MAG: hemerythrin domain-containing protein [Brevundimonas sp.]|uniref:hemerythrin domain-containing protein n=1 Tax=Brevundimonas sp. TaxID=1871086 RepID=UPI0026235E21|nr:hemerythrin domain-containing protein [Brevundimonas sp.]MDI6623616.1 hemerythrin domain-containing protein [Brevundimonas sp.]MDQ7812799.1 hemerythrin domain-containing protein [Brevundimonas sp.]
MSEAPDDPLALASRVGLPSDCLYLREAFPRERWTTDGLHPTARRWLHMHGGFRAHQAEMGAMIEAWRAGAVDASTLHRALIPALQQFLQHLDGHHRIESGHYFPALRQLEPRIAAGIELLDRDHDAIHAHIEAMVRTGRALHEAVAGRATDAGDRVERLAEVLDLAGPQLARHLYDEEDIVIPLIALRGDPLE